MAQPHDDARWQLTSLFDSIEGDAYRAARAELEERLVGLGAFLDEHEIGGGEPWSAEAARSANATATLVELIDHLNHLHRGYVDIAVFLTGFTAVDAFNDLAQAETSTLRLFGSRLAPLEARITAWIGRLPLAELPEHATLQSHAHMLRRRAAAAQHLMSDPEEGLAAALAPSGGGSWAKLHTDLVSKATVMLQLEVDTGPEEAGLARLRVLQGHADRAVRRRAYEAEQQLLETHVVAFAAAMNGVKGEVTTLTRRRGWETPLDEALFQNGVTRAALSALQGAVREAFPSARRYLRAKANFLGLEVLSWYDLLAPVSVGPERAFDWPEAQALILERFADFSASLEALARRAFEESWIDVLPRKGKRNGAFCMGAPGARESRVMLNFGGGLDDIFTLAHELGHAFHNDCMYRAGRTVLQSSTPMTLAETASIFCETLIVNALLEGGDDATRLAVLEQDLLSATQLLVDIDSRFRFEQAVFEKRSSRDLSIKELDELMLDAQEATYGDALASDTRHSRMWAQKGHYYSASRSFYNFPYTFGYLFGLGVTARYQADPAGFSERYEALLSSTGMASVAELAQRFDIDVEAPEFWNGALGLMEQRVATYEALVERFKGGS